MSFLDSIFNPISSAVKSIVNPIYNSVLKPGYESVVKPIFHAAEPILSQVAPIAGSLIGARFGGPQGAMMGGQVGSMASGLLDKLAGNDHSQPAPSYAPQAPEGYESPVPQGYSHAYHPTGGGIYAAEGTPSIPGLSDVLQGYGQSFNERVNPYIPESFRGESFGNLGHVMGGMMGDRLGSLGDRFGFGLGDMGRNAGSYFGRHASDFMGSHMPEFMRHMPMGDIGGFASRGIGDWLSNRFGIGGGEEDYPPAPPLPPRPASHFNYERPAALGRGEAPALPPRTRGVPPPLPPRDHPPYVPPAPPLPQGLGGPAPTYRNPIEEMNAKFASGQPLLRPTAPALPPRPKQGYGGVIDELKSRFAQGAPLRNTSSGGGYQYPQLPAPPKSRHDQLMAEIMARRPRYEG